MNRWLIESRMVWMTQRSTFHSQEPLQSPRLTADLILRFEQGSRWAQTVQACGCGGSERASQR